MSDSVPATKSYEELMGELAELRAQVARETSFCLFQKDHDGRIVWVNEEFRQFIGRPASEILGRSDYELFPASFAHKYRDDDRRVMLEGKPFHSFETVNNAHGSTHFVYILKLPHRDDGGGINGVLGAFWASAPRSEVEVRLHQSEARLRAIIDHLPVMVCALDNRGRIVYGNRECERLTGYPVAEIVGNPAGLALLYPDENYRQALLDQWRQGVGAQREWEFTLTCKDGSPRTIIWSDVGVDCPIPGWASWGIGVDVTEKNQALGVLEAIRTVQDNFIAKAPPEALFEQCLKQLLAVTRSEFGFIGEILHTPDGRPFLKTRVTTNISWNEQARQDGLEFHALQMLLGDAIASGQSVIVNDPRPGGLPDGCPPLRSYLGAPLYHNQQFIGMAGIANRPGGYAPPIVQSLAPLLSTCAAMIYHHRLESQQQNEEAERLRLEAQLQYAQKLESLGVLAGGIAHDFNNLLVTILGHASLAGEELALSASARDNLKQIETAAVRAADLCKQMLAYSGKGHFIVCRINLSELVEEMTHLMQISISKKVVLRHNLVKNLPPIEADATQIRQVLMNLITNASEACGEASGLISISTGVMDVDHEYLATTFLNAGLSAGNYVYMEVSDTGCGMDETTRAKLFDPFFTTKAMGRGLGMAAVLGIVRGHRGAIKCYSEPGRGSTFKVLFPVVAGEAEPPQDMRPAAPVRGSGAILVVDDEEGVRSRARISLERSGFKVLTAKDGREGVDVYKAFQAEIVLVLLDMTMPELTGDEVFRELRKLREDVCVVLSSGYNEQEATNRFVGKGLAGFIQKPYRPSELVEAVNRALAQGIGADLTYLA